MQASPRASRLATTAASTPFAAMSPGNFLGRFGVWGEDEDSSQGGSPCSDEQADSAPVEPGNHRLPDSVMWKITAVSSVGMALLNLMTIWSMRTLVKFKFHMMQTATHDHGVNYGILALVSVACLFASCCMALIFIVEPSAGSSGAPENKGWLNGNGDGSFFTKKSLIVRGVATILGNAAGYPVGREGPTVTMGSNFAYLICDCLAEPHVKTLVVNEFTYQVNIGDESAELSPLTPTPSDEGDATRTMKDKKDRTRILDQQRLLSAKRVACAIAGACGMAMIFDSPIGGILYMFEEVTATCWPFELTFRAFTGTITCALLSRALLNLCSTDTKAFVLYEWSPLRHPWDWWDLPTFFFIALVLGPFSVLHTKICLKVQTYRQNMMEKLKKCQPYAKVLDAILYAAFCATTCATVALLGNCEPLRPGDSRELVRFNCKETEYNPVASLLLTTSEGAVNLLFSRRNEDEIHPTNAGLALVAYTTINMGLTGVPAPSGNFTGTMLIGGLVGRILGELSRRITYGDAAPGIYAMAGSAAMLCGFKRMSLAVVWFVSSASSDFNIVPPLMLSVAVSYTLAQYLKEKGYDEEQILRRNVPFLEADPPPLFDSMNAQDLAKASVHYVPAHLRLEPEMAAVEVDNILKSHPDVLDFPVVRKDPGHHGGVCIGFTSRDRLQNAVGRYRKFVQEPNEPGESDFTPIGVDVHLVKEREPVLPANARLNVQKLIDCAPYVILKDMPAPRLYALFSKGGVSIASVVGTGGKFEGMITRAGLIKHTRLLEEKEEVKKANSTKTSPSGH